MEEVEKTRNRRGNRKKMKGEDSMQGKKLDSPLPEERQVGDGAPAESANEATLPDETATDAEEQEFGAETGAGAPLFHLRLEVDVVCIALFLVALFTRLHRLDEPRSIVFDELHYGRYVSLYTRGVFFFDSHPPLGKQLLYAAARAAGYDGNFTFDKIGTEYAPSVPVWALRFPSALAGSLLVPLAYQLAALLCASRWSAALAGLLVLCDNALLVQSRFALLEPLLLAFSLSGVLCAVRAARARAAPARALWLTLAAAALACCFSVKFVGFYSYLLGVFLIGREFWGLLPKKEHSAVSIVLNFAWRSLTLVAVPLAVYLGVFYVHVSLLTRAGPHDSVMTSAFQASLEGGLASITKGQPLHVAHGSQITLRYLFHVMTPEEQSKIKRLEKCDFKEMHAYFAEQSEKNRNRSKEEKAALKAKNEAIQKEYGFCTIDGHKEKIGNFRIEPPGLFRGRGEHPKMGMLKKRVMPEHVLINCSKGSKIPTAPDGRRWKEVRHDNKVTWLASWVENVQGQVKYVMLNPSSKLKGEKDWQKYETARQLHQSIDKIRETYKEDWKAKEMRVRQRAVALYFIDRLALRAGNEKDDDQADTVGCCSLRVEHIELHREKDGKEYVVVFDFPGKDSIRYYNEVPVEKRVFKNLELFKENKKDGDDLFDRLNTSTLNEHLKELMPALTAKVFRTYNASITLQRQLDELTDPDATVPEKILAYNRANRAVAILCNHQRSVPKGHEKSMGALKEKMQQKRDQIDEAEEDLREAMRAAKRGSAKEKINADKKKKALERLRDQLKKMELQETDRDENKTIALGTSKLNYLDPRISVAWCKKHGVPLEKVYNKTQRDKFRWAIDMAGPDYVF